MTRQSQFRLFQINKFYLVLEVLLYFRMIEPSPRYLTAKTRSQPVLLLGTYLGPWQSE
jgi:hypothetical protein